jgi:hypothetical protein
LRKLLGLTALAQVRLVPSDAAIQGIAGPLPIVGEGPAPGVALARQKVEVARWLVSLAESGAAMHAMSLSPFPCDSLFDLPLVQSILASLPEKVRVRKRPVEPAPEPKDQPRRGVAFLARILLEVHWSALAEAESRHQHWLERYSLTIARWHAHVGETRAQRLAVSEHLQARQRAFLAGRGTLDLLLEAQRFAVDSLAGEYRMRAEYAIARCYFAYALGAIPKERIHAGTAAAERERTRIQARQQRKLPLDALFSLRDGPPDGYTLPGLWKSLPPLRQVGSWPAADGQIPTPPR